MKTIFKITIAFMLISSVFSACKRDLTIATIGDATLILKASLPETANSTVILSKEQPIPNVLHTEWSKPQHLTDPSLGNIAMKYVLQFDVNESFTKPYLIDFTVKRDSIFSSSSLNAILNELGCTPEVSNRIYMRVQCISSINTIVSNTYSFNAIPYSVIIKPKIDVPEALIITGAALPGGWVVPFPETQRFTKISATIYVLTAELLGGKSYELITDVNGNNWTPCYHIAPTDDPLTLVYGGNFIADGDGTIYNWSGKPFLAPAENGIYKLTFDFQSATFKVEKI